MTGINVPEVVAGELIKIGNQETLKIKPLVDNFKMPVKAHNEDACFDCYAHDIEYKKDGKIIAYNLGFACQPPEGYHVAIYPRSSIYKAGLVLCNSRGTIDNPYRGSISALFYVVNEGNDFKPYEIGDRICQMRLVKDIDTKLVLSGTLSDTVRGDGGFGSTGRK